jgi:hypothetical protein
MREILFKAKRWSDGKWVYGDLNQLQDSTIIHWYNNGCRVADEVDPSTVCQWTGLIDRDGTKVFEGDRLFDPHEKRTFVVEYDPLEAGFTLESNDGRYVDFNRVPYSKIIGNIHDGEGGQHEGAEHD